MKRTRKKKSKKYRKPILIKILKEDSVYKIQSESEEDKEDYTVCDSEEDKNYEIFQSEEETEEDYPIFDFEEDTIDHTPKEPEPEKEKENPILRKLLLEDSLENLKYGTG